MKKIISIILLCSTAALLSEDVGYLALRGGAFFPSHCLFKNIYGSAAGIVELEAGLRVYKCLQAWINFDWLSKKGHSIGFCNPTKIRLPSLSLGLKIPYEINECWNIYAGLGPTFSRVSIKNQSLCGTSCCAQGSTGLVVKTGIDYFFCNHGMIDLFFDYVYQPVKFQQCVNIGGFRVGAGIGARF